MFALKFIDYRKILYKGGISAEVLYVITARSTIGRKRSCAHGCLPGTSHTPPLASLSPTTEQRLLVDRDTQIHSDLADSAVRVGF